MARIDHSLTSVGGAGATTEAPLTLAQVRARLGAVPGLSGQARADLCSALNTVGRALTLPLDAIPSAPAILRARLDQVRPAALGIKPQSWANTRSRLLKALRLTGVPVMAGRNIGVYTPEWQQLKDRVPGKYARCKLSRLFSFCSARGIAPEDVTAATFEAYRTSVEHESLRARHTQAFRETVLAWNAARETIPGWPDVVVPVPDRRDWYALPWSTFPPSLKADIDAMVLDATGADLVGMKARRRIKPQSALRRVGHLQRLISGYVHRGGDPNELRSLADVVQLDVVREGLRFHLDRAGGKPTVGIDGIAIAACTVARQWVGIPQKELEALKRIRRSLGRKPHEMAPATRALLRSFDDPQRLAALLNAPRKIFAGVSGRNQLTRSQAVTISVALAVQILLDAPIRVHNLASIDLDRHVLRIGSGRNARVHLHFAAEEVKNTCDLELPLSAETVALLDVYLDFVRQQLIRTPNSFLFPGDGARHKGEALLSNQIAGFVHEHVGVRMTAHKFRHLVGYLFLKRHPGGHEVVRQLLGHKSIETTIKFYAPMEQDEAFRLYDGFLDELRGRAADASPLGRH